MNLERTSTFKSRYLERRYAFGKTCAEIERELRKTLPKEELPEQQNRIISAVQTYTWLSDADKQKIFSAVSQYFKAKYLIIHIEDIILSDKLVRQELDFKIRLFLHSQTRRVFTNPQVYLEEGYLKIILKEEDFIAFARDIKCKGVYDSIDLHNVIGIPAKVGIVVLPERADTDIEEHEYQHFMNDTVLDFFKGIEQTNSGDNVRKLKDEVMARIRSGHSLTEFFFDAEYDYLSKLFSKEQQEILQNFLRSIEIELNDLGDISDEDKKVLLYMLIDIPLSSFHKWINSFKYIFDLKSDEQYS